MVLAKSEHKAAGQDSRFPYLVSDPTKQDAIADVRITSLLKKKLYQKILISCADVHIAFPPTIKLYEKSPKLNQESHRSRADVQSTAMSSTTVAITNVINNFFSSFIVSCVCLLDSGRMIKIHMCRLIYLLYVYVCIYTYLFI